MRPDHNAILEHVIVVIAPLADERDTGARVRMSEVIDAGVAASAAP
jgi:hypothetical protein